MLYRLLNTKRRFGQSDCLKIYGQAIHEDLEFMSMLGQRCTCHYCGYKAIEIGTGGEAF